MNVNDFQSRCPKNAHICSMYLKNPNHYVMSAKGYDIVDGKPGVKAIVWNKYGKAYSRIRTQQTKNWTNGIFFQGFLFERDEQFDLILPKYENK